MSDAKDITELHEREITSIAKSITAKVKSIHARETETRESHEEQWMDTLAERSTMNSKPYAKKVLVVVTTPKTESEYKATKYYKSIEKIMYVNTVNDNDGLEMRVDLEIVSNNKTGLSEVYNRFISDTYSDYYVCFIHDDVILSDVDLFEKLQEAHESAEIVGVAGATKIKVPFTFKERTAWHLLSAMVDPVGGEYKSYQSGSVLHEQNGECWSTPFGRSPQICRVIDGLFMSLDIAKCSKYGFSFDERFAFHHYDLAGCIKAQECGLVIKTWPIMVQHDSVGQLDASWGVSHRKFVDLYGYVGK